MTPTGVPASEAEAEYSFELLVDGRKPPISEISKWPLHQVEIRRDGRCFVFPNRKNDLPPGLTPEILNSFKETRDIDWWRDECKRLENQIVESNEMVSSLRSRLEGMRGDAEAVLKVYEKHETASNLASAVLALLGKGE